jgi:hypothetical protein
MPVVKGIMMSILVMRTIYFSFLISTLLIINGCGAVSSSDDPDLNRFDIIDTSGSDSATDAESELSIDPDEENIITVGNREGEFTLYWDVDTDENYRLTIRVNDDGDFGGEELYSDICDPDEDCHDEQNLSCDYTNDLNVVCEDFDDNESSIDVERIANEDDLPQDLFFILQVCDPFGFGCEDQSIRVEFRD